jgi:hypothetical protein
MFHYKFIAALSSYTEGKMTHDKVFEALKWIYRTEQATDTRANLMPSKLEINMLTTNLANANVELHKMKALGGGSGRGNGDGRDGGGGRDDATRWGNGNCGAGMGSGGTNYQHSE